MKIIYCIHSVYNPGGMERVLLNKVTYLKKHLGWDIVIVTTDQHSRPPFYPFPENVRMVDLDINYSDDNHKNPIMKILGYLKKRKIHRRRLEELLMKEKADITVSLYPCESSFIPRIKDGSKKVLELHYCKFFRLQYGRSGLLGMIDGLRTRQDERIVRRFDRFVVLTEEDKGYWGDMPNITVIPNAALQLSDKVSDVTAKRVLAVGRLDYQKGFDRLIEAWEIVQKHDDAQGWRLDIFGQGEWESMLKAMVEDKGLSSSIEIHKPTDNIREEYISSSILAMTSHYEGFPMVMIEAMACGLAVVTFNYKCGPADIINNGVSGLIVNEGDIQGFAEALLKIIRDEKLRKSISTEALKITERYSESAVMKKWVNLFEEIDTL